MKTTSPYKTAAELGTQQWEHDALVALIEPLSLGELKFDMLKGIHHCGCAACIGGWVDANAQRDWYTSSIRSALFDSSSPLQELYYPKPGAAYRATGPQAARAIVNFLTTGDPKWDDVMSAPSIDTFDADDSGAREHVIEREDA